MSTLGFWHLFPAKSLAISDILKDANSCLDLHWAPEHFLFCSCACFSLYLNKKPCCWGSHKQSTGLISEAPSIDFGFPADLEWNKSKWSFIYLLALLELSGFIPHSIRIQLGLWGFPPSPSWSQRKESLLWSKVTDAKGSHWWDLFPCYSLWMPASGSWDMALCILLKRRPHSLVQDCPSLACFSDYRYVEAI